jgi:hypothetical protein
MGIILSGPTVLLPSAGSVTAASMAAAVAAADDAADVSAALAAPVVDPLTGAGWTAGTPSGGAAATWTSGTRLRVAVPTGVEGAAWVQRDDLLPDGPEWDFYTRVDIVAGDTADALAVAGGRWGRLYVTAISGGVVGGLTVDFLAIRTRASVPL